MVLGPPPHPARHQGPIPRIIGVGPAAISLTLTTSLPVLNVNFGPVASADQRHPGFGDHTPPFQDAPSPL